MADTETGDFFPPDSNEFKLLNDCAKRVHTVMCVAGEKYAMPRPEQALSHNETMALLNGAMSGIAVMAAQMTVGVVTDAGPDVEPPEVYLADMLREQFLTVYRAQVSDTPFVTEKPATTH